MYIHAGSNALTKAFRLAIAFVYSFVFDITDLYYNNNNKIKDNNLVIQLYFII